MVAKILLSDKDRYLSMLRSPEEAYVLSRLESGPMTLPELRETSLSHVSEKEFIEIINRYRDLNLINIKEVDEHKESIFFRHYKKGDFPEEELCETKKIPENIKKEILFLYHRGRDLDLYEILNISDPQTVSKEELNKRIDEIRSFFALSKFIGKNIGSFRKKVEFVNRLLEKLDMLKDDKKREAYNKYLTKKGTLKNKKSYEDDKKKVANEHHSRALKLLSKNRVHDALEEIEIATYMDPENNEFKELEKRLKNSLKNLKIKKLYKFLRENENILFDEKKLSETIDEILSLSSDKNKAHLKIAEIMLEKEIPEMSIEHIKKISKNSINSEELKIIAKKCREQIKKRDETDNS